jgi:hypothetical protein
MWNVSATKRRDITPYVFEVLICKKKFAGYKYEFMYQHGLEQREPQDI